MAWRIFAYCHRHFVNSGPWWLYSSLWRRYMVEFQPSTLFHHLPLITLFDRIFTILDQISNSHGCTHTQFHLYVQREILIQLTAILQWNNTCLPNFHLITYKTQYLSFWSTTDFWIHIFHKYRIIIRFQAVINSARAAHHGPTTAVSL